MNKIAIMLILSLGFLTFANTRLLGTVTKMTCPQEKFENYIRMDDTLQDMLNEQPSEQTFKNLDFQHNGYLTKEDFLAWAAADMYRNKPETWEKNYLGQDGYPDCNKWTTLREAVDEAAKETVNENKIIHSDLKNVQKTYRKAQVRAQKAAHECEMFGKYLNLLKNHRIDMSSFEGSFGIIVNDKQWKTLNFNDGDEDFFNDLKKDKDQLIDVMEAGAWLAFPKEQSGEETYFGQDGNPDCKKWTTIREQISIFFKGSDHISRRDLPQAIKSYMRYEQNRLNEQLQAAIKNFQVQQAAFRRAYDHQKRLQNDLRRHPSDKLQKAVSNAENCLNDAQAKYDQAQEVQDSITTELITYQRAFNGSGRSNRK